MLRTRVEMKQKVGVMVGVGDHSLCLREGDGDQQNPEPG